MNQKFVAKKYEKEKSKCKQDWDEWNQKYTLSSRKKTNENINIKISD